MTNLLINQRFDFITLIIFLAKPKIDDKEGLRDPPSILSLCLCLLAFRPIKTWGVGLRGLAMLKRGRIFLLRVPPLILI